jgi:hypothetical protein
MRYASVLQITSDMQNATVTSASQFLKFLISVGHKSVIAVTLVGFGIIPVKWAIFNMFYAFPSRLFWFVLVQHLLCIKTERNWVADITRSRWPEITDSVFCKSKPKRKTNNLKLLSILTVIYTAEWVYRPPELMK